MNVNGEQVFDALPDAVIGVDDQGRIVLLNPQAERLFGYTRAELLGQPVELLVPEQLRRAHMQHHNEYFAAPRVRPMGVGLNLAARRKDGSEIPVDISLSPLQTPTGLLVIAAIRDMRAQRELEAILRQQQEWDRLVLDHLQDVVYMVAVEREGDALRGRVVAVYGPTHEVTGHPPEAFRADPDLWLRLLHPEDVPTVAAQTARSVATRQPVLRSYRIHHAISHGYRWIEDKVIPQVGPDGRVVALFGVARDVTERQWATEQLTRLAFHDALTSLANRALFLDRLAHALAHARRHRHGVGVLFLDVDGFKHINDSLGHSAGDRLLIHISRQLIECLRSEDTVSRFGGDEFAVLLDQVSHTEDAVQVAERILTAVRAPITLEGREITASVSIGVVVPCGEGLEVGPEEVLRQADIALYRAKATGKARYALFTPSMHADALTRLDLEVALRRAVERGELCLHYQPEVDLASGAIVGMEALVRWQHPARGLLAPSEFVPLAEETGLIIPIGRWVLTEACRQARAWLARYPGGTPWVMSVNLSARQFLHPALVDEVAQILHDTRLEASRLRLEVTETVAMQDASAAAATLAQLKALGVGLALDDFGTGYSSLSYLRRFPLDVVKLDRSFIEDLRHDRATVAIVRAVVGAAHELGLEVVAEGIETREQLASAYLVHCDRGQGYYFARPLEAAAMGTRLGASVQ